MNPSSPVPDSLATRRTLLERLRAGEGRDAAGWAEFCRLYGRLIHNVARKAGLDHADAQDVVQESLLSVVEALPGFDPDPAKGRFRPWLLRIVRRRIVDHRRSRGRRERNVQPLSEDGDEAALAPELDRLWQEEWEASLLQAALERVRAKVPARQFLLFDLAAVRRVPAREIARSLDVGVARVYLARHRVGRLVRAEAERLRAQDGF